MLDDDAVRLAYGVLIGKEAPPGKTIEALARNCGNFRQLRNRLMALPVYQRRVGEGGMVGISNPLVSAPQPEIEVDVGRGQLAALLEHVESVWRQFGDTEAHWSVLTNDRYRAENLEQHKAEFYASGEKEVQRFRWAAARGGVDIDRLGDCLELGAGVGRITLSLARVFPRVHAADISASHLAVAEAELRSRGVTNVDYHRVASVAELDALPEADAFISIISLQHSPPPVMKLVLEKVLRRLRPGGVGHFQLPTQIVNYRFTVQEFLHGKATKKEMEHHALPQSVAFDVIAAAGCRVLECQQDSHSRVNKISNTFTVQKVG